MKRILAISLAIIALAAISHAGKIVKNLNINKEIVGPIINNTTVNENSITKILKKAVDESGIFLCFNSIKMTRLQLNAF